MNNFKTMGNMFDFIESKYPKYRTPAKVRFLAKGLDNLSEILGDGDSAPKNNVEMNTLYNLLKINDLLDSENSALLFDFISQKRMPIEDSHMFGIVGKLDDSKLVEAVSYFNAKLRLNFNLNYFGLVLWFSKHPQKDAVQAIESANRHKERLTKQQSEDVMRFVMGNQGREGGDFDEEIKRLLDINQRITDSQMYDDMDF